MWIEALPMPGIGAHVCEIPFSAPTEERRGFAGIGVTSCDVTGTARGDLVGDGLAASLLKGSYNLQYTVAGSSPEIDRETCGWVGPLPQSLQCFEMSDGEIDDMDVVAHTGPVRSRVVIAEYVQMGAAADRHLRHEGH